MREPGSNCSYLRIKWQRKMRYGKVHPLNRAQARLHRWNRQWERRDRTHKIGTP
jgi:hypothetical protein